MEPMNFESHSPLIKGVFNPEDGVLRLENTSFWRDNL